MNVSSIYISNKSLGMRQQEDLSSELTNRVQWTAGPRWIITLTTCVTPPTAPSAALLHFIARSSGANYLGTDDDRWWQTSLHSIIISVNTILHNWTTWWAQAVDRICFNAEWIHPAIHLWHLVSLSWDRITLKLCHVDQPEGEKNWYDHNMTFLSQVRWV